MTPKLIVRRYLLAAAVGDVTAIRVPESARIIHGGLDPSGAVCVWIEQEQGHTPKIELRFVIQKSETPFVFNARHVATFVKDWFVGHIYEV